MKNYSTSILKGTEVCVSHSVMSDSLRPHGLCSLPVSPLSMEFSRQEYWSGLSFPPAGDLSNPGTESKSTSLQADSLPSEPPGKPNVSSMFKGLRRRPQIRERNPVG